MRVYVETYGCSLNQGDSEIIAGILSEKGFEIVEDESKADIIIINTCVVKKPTENRVMKRLKEIEKVNKKVIVAGCMPKVIDLKNLFPRFSIIGPSQLFEIAEIIDKVMRNERVIRLDEIKRSKLDLPKIRKNPLIEIIAISSGCIGDCSYCCVKFARGKLFSYPPEKIIERVEKSLSDGVKEIWLTAQDTGCYGFDIKSNLAELLERICKLDGKFFVRVGMMNPNNIKDILGDLVEIYKNEKIFKFLHIPVQSGSNKILKQMNRFYQIEDFKGIVNTFRNEIPGITISTDVICGFPNETEEDFEASIDLIKEIKPDVLNISRFFPRPKTNAERMEQLPGYKIKERSRKLAKIFNQIALEKNKTWLGWQGEVIVDEIANNNTFISRNFAYKPIVIKSKENLFSKFLNVRIIGATKNSLIGEKI